MPLGHKLAFRKEILQKINPSVIPEQMNLQSAKNEC